MNIVLFGFMGVGKTSVGKIIAKITGMNFVDLDEEIVKRVGKSIPEIFRDDGEPYFRDVERQVTQQIASRSGQVIACGGGTILGEENLMNLKKTSRMVLLEADAENILERVEREGENRPLLSKDANKLGRIKNLLKTRQSKYSQAADIVINTSDKTPEQAACEILEKLRGVQENACNN